MNYTHDDIVLLLGPPQVGGLQAVILDLGPGERAWNPVRNDTQLRGPAKITYVRWADGGWDCTARNAVNA